MDTLNRSELACRNEMTRRAQLGAPVSLAKAFSYCLGVAFFTVLFILCAVLLAPNDTITLQFEDGSARTMNSTALNAWYAQ